MRYLSAEWFEAAGKALTADEALRQATADAELVLEQVVTDVPGAPGGVVRWQVVLHHGEVDLVLGPTDRADLRFTTSYRVAAAVAQGQLAAAEAFVAGDLVAHGDLSLLSSRLRALAAVDDALRDVRGATTFA